MKKILITGSSSGFGRQMVDELLEEGHTVIATLRNASERKELFENSPKKDNLVILSLDVTKKEERAEVRDYIENNLGGSLDVLINNAGYGIYGALEDISEEQIRYQMEVNFIGSTLLIKDFLPFLRKAKGKIINISSVMGRFSMPLGSVYSASKYAMEGVTEGLYYELQNHGVQITTVQPGAHRTGFAKSIVWGEGVENPGSPYRGQTVGLRAMMDKLMARPSAPGSQSVSSVVSKLVTSSNMPRRVLVGKDAQSVGWTQKLFPEWLYHLILSVGYKARLKA